jgi:hypothetical protein
VEHRSDAWGQFNADIRDALNKKDSKKEKREKKEKKKKKESLIRIDPFAVAGDRTRVIRALRLQPNLLHYLTNCL